MSMIQLPTDKDAVRFLSSVSAVNNLLSVFNNFKQDNMTETKRSAELFVSDIIGILREFIKSPTFQKIGTVVNIEKNYEILDRLVVNVTKFKQDSKDNNGYVGKSLVIDIFADFVALGDAFLDLIGKVPTIKFNPANVVFNIISLFATTTSTSMNMNPKWNDKQLIHVDEIDNLILDGAILTLKNWDVMVQPLKDAVADFFNPLFESNAISFIGDQNDNKDDVIDPDRFFDYSYEIYGLSGNDTLIGGYKKDVIKGGIGNDILKGKENQDHLFGGTGFDTYYIQDNDIIYDEDMGGLLLFNNGTTEFKAVRFQRIDDNSDKWQGLDENNQRIDGLTATRQDNDLFVKYDYEKAVNEEGNTINAAFTDSALIKNFFTLAKSTQPTDGNTALGMEWIEFIFKKQTHISTCRTNSNSLFNRQTL